MLCRDFNAVYRLSQYVLGSLMAARLVVPDHNNKCHRLCDMNIKFQFNLEMQCCSNNMGSLEILERINVVVNQISLVHN